MSTYTIVTTGIVLSDSTLQNPATIVSGGQITNTTGTAGGDGVNGDNSFAWTLVNYGTINATTTYSNGVRLSAGGLVVNGAAGLIIGPDGVEINGTAGGTVLNAGTILSTNEYGVRLDNGGSVSNGTGTVGGALISGVNVGILVLNAGGTVNNGHLGFSAATISGATYGIRSRDAAAIVTNFGTIVGTAGAGISLYSGGTVTNAAGGVVSSSNGGIEIKNTVGSVDNKGIVQSTNLAVSLASGALTNQIGGTITGGGGVQIGGTGTLDNAGTITGTAATGSGVVFSAGGSIQNGGTATTDALIAGTLRGVTIYNATGTVTNFGTISASITYAGALYLHGGGRVTNQLSGLIQGGGVGISVLNNGGTVENFGTVSGLNAVGILFQSGGSIGNSGLIFGGNYGINLFGGAGTITNSGTIASNGTGVRLAASTLTNTGTIVGSNGIAVYFVSGTNRLIVNPGAVFSGSASGISVNDTLELAAGAGTIAGFGSSFSGFEQIVVDASATWLLAGYNVLAAGTTLSNAGTLTLSGTLLDNGVIGIGPGAALALDGVFGGSGIIDFPGVGGGTLEIGGTVMPSNTITGVEPGDAFRLPDVPFDASGTAVLRPGNVLRVHENGSDFDLQLSPGEDFTGKFFHLAPDGGGTLVTEDTAPCFCRGTRILTDCGEAPVEQLAIGDMVMTVSGAARPIKWIGRRAYDGRFIAGNRQVLPIRIATNALATGVPARDLWVSPAHSLYLDGVLVQAEHIVNGATIVQADRVEEVEYFHIELDTHDIIFADGAPAETFADCDNRLMFANGAEYAALYPDDERPRWEFCVPRLEWGTDELTAIRAALLWRAEALDHNLECDPNLRLIVDGETVLPNSITGDHYRFTVPPGSEAVWLASRSTVPAEVIAASQDLRQLGVPVERIVLSDADLTIEVWHGHAALSNGFHEDEAGHRWTDGQARLPDSWLWLFPSALTLDLHLTPSALPYRPRATERPAVAA